MRKIWLYAGISEYPTLVDIGLYSGHTENMLGADNQQATPRKWESPQRLYAKYPKKLNEKEAILLGILYTDGCLSKKSENCWRFYLSNTSYEIIQAFKDCMIELFDLDDHRVRISQKIVNGKPFYKAVVDSGACGNLLTAKYGTFRTLAFKSADGVKSYPPTKLPFNQKTSNILISKFLQAAFSCDGGVKLYVAKMSKTEYRFLIRNVFLSCHHPQLRLDYIDLLTLLGINAKILQDDNRIIIQGRADLQKFRNKIGFLKGVKITQHSRFWQGWEKNQVLDLLLSSYSKDDRKKILGLARFRIMR